MSFDIEWIGKDELGDLLQKAIDQSEENVDKVIKNNGEKLQARAKVHAPKRTRFLMNSINAEHSHLQSEITSQASYAIYQEYGTRFQPGKAHIRPAFHETIPGLERDIKDVAEGLFG
ncbi:HK97 gp10 family phage protein [Aerococcaceae bacterium DSM 111020]|nr:HK97 gp10 family phage protein [Aerococcaceae bacterium DSM 111020]